mmetsp:Transcript_11555/g.18545  ORF Transcript_11555/g.18545 Transcript_11555/m.18545 type:complete len:206 (-) Transcript_11555:382-999(-)
MRSPWRTVLTFWNASDAHGTGWFQHLFNIYLQIPKGRIRVLLPSIRSDINSIAIVVPTVLRGVFNQQCCFRPKTCGGRIRRVPDFAQILGRPAWTIQGSRASACAPVATMTVKFTPPTVSIMSTVAVIDFMICFSRSLSSHVRSIPNKVKKSRTTTTSTSSVVVILVVCFVNFCHGTQILSHGASPSCRSCSPQGQAMASTFTPY